MVSKRKQNRKVKREIRRKVRQNKAQTQQPAVPKDQDMMLKLMAMLKGGGGNGQSMDPATFLRAREEVVAKTNENARLKREAKEKEEQAKNDEKLAQGDFDVRKAQRSAEIAKQHLAQKQDLLKYKGTEQGLDLDQRKIQQEIDDYQHKLELQNIGGSIDAKRIEVGNLKKKLEKIQNSLDMKTDSQEIRDSINRAVAHINRMIDEMNVIFEHIGKRQVQQIELRALEDLIERVQDEMHNLIKQNVALRNDIGIRQNDIDNKRSLTEEYHKEKKEFGELQNKRKQLIEQQKVADHVPEYDQQGNIKMKYKAELRKLVEPEEDEKVNALKAEKNEIAELLADKSKQFSSDEWADILLKHGNSLTQEQNSIISKLKRNPFELVYTNSDGRKYRGYQKIRDYFKSLNDQIDNALKAAKEKYEEDKRYNHDIEQNQTMKTIPITNEMLGELRIEKDKRELELEARMRDIERKQKFAQEYENKKAEKDKMEAYLRQLPATEDDQPTLMEIGKINAVLNELKKQQDLKVEEGDYLNQLAQQRRELQRQIRALEIANKSSPRTKQEEMDVYYRGIARQQEKLSRLDRRKLERNNDVQYQNELMDKNKELARQIKLVQTEVNNYPEIDDKTQQLMEDNEEARQRLALAEEHKRVKELTHNAEKAQRQLEASLNASRKKQVRDLQNEIARSEQELAVRQEQTAQLEKLRETQKAVLTQRAANAAKAKATATATSDEVVNMQIEESAAYNHELSNTLEAQNERLWKRQELVSRMAKNHSMLAEFNAWARAIDPQWVDYKDLNEVATSDWLLTYDGEDCMNRYIEGDDPSPPAPEQK